MPVYLIRDLLVRIFYALGDGKTPFQISTIGIFLNIIFDWLLVGGPTPWGHQLSFNFGAAGLVLATIGINLFSCFMLLYILNARIGNLPLREWYIDGLKLIFAGLGSGLCTWLIGSVFHWPSGFISLSIQISLSTATSLLAFCVLGMSMQVKEVKELMMLVRHKIIRL